MSERKKAWSGGIGKCIHDIALIYALAVLMGWVPGHLTALAACTGLLGLYLIFKAEGVVGIYETWLDFALYGLQMTVFFCAMGVLFGSIPLNLTTFAHIALLAVLCRLLKSYLMKRACKRGQEKARQIVRKMQESPEDIPSTSHQPL